MKSKKSIGYYKKVKYIMKEPTLVCDRCREDYINFFKK